MVLSGFFSGGREREGRGGWGVWKGGQQGAWCVFLVFGAKVVIKKRKRKEEKEEEEIMRE